MHIKFLEHGKGSAAKASAYLLDKLDHMGNVRSGVDVLRGDAITFNAICDSSPHLWKYTSGVIAWSKEDTPTDEQIKEVLNDFESHAFAGLDPSQYHLFAVLHTDQDGSKHIHVLTPRLDIQSGKSLNIAPPGHEKHFDSLRDYFNTKYQWSRPDDLLLMQTTQEPNYVTKLNAQAKKILSSQEFEILPKKQFCQAMDNYVRTLLKTQIAENRADIVACLKQLDCIDSIKPSKDFLTVTLNNGKKHRLKGDFYHEKFEIGSYSEHLRAAAESRPTPSELAAALTDADQLRATYRAKREAYNQQHYAFTASTADDNSPRITPTRDFDRDRESITPENKNTHIELYTTNRSTPVTTSGYRYCGNIKSEIEHRFVFNLNSGSTEPHQQPVAEHFNRQAESTKEHSNPSTASDSEPKRTDRERNTNADHGKIERTEIQIHSLGDDRFWTADSFNRFISGLSNQYKSKDNRSAARSHSTEHTTNFKSNQNLESIPEISNADRNRPFFDRAKRLIESTKQLVSQAKQRIESTSQFIKEHLEQLQRSRAELKNPAQTTASLDFSTANRAIQDQAEQLFGAITASISRELEDPIANAINESIESTRFKPHYQQISAGGIKTCPDDDKQTADRSQERTLENLAIASAERLLQRLTDAARADQCAWRNGTEIDSINRGLKRLESTISSEIRLKPKSATDFYLQSLRNDNYYPDYVAYHTQLCNKQQQAFDKQDHLRLIDYTQQKAENLETYMTRASNNIYPSDYEKFEKIIKNDQRMLKHLQCETILESHNARFEQHRATYQTCLKYFESISTRIHEIKNPASQSEVAQSNETPTNKSELKSELGFDY